MAAGLRPSDDPETEQPPPNESALPTSWNLFRETANVPQLGLLTQLVKIRTVDVDEYERIADAEALFNRFGTNGWHTVAVRQAQMLLDTIGRLQDSANQAAGQINTADLERVRRALEAFADHITRWVRDGAEDGPLAEPAAIAANTMPVRVCIHVADGDPFKVVVGQRPTGEIVVGLQDVLPDSSDTIIDPVRVVSESLVACRPIADAELEAAESELLAAGSFLLGFLAEVVWGRPVLIPAGSDSDGERMHLNLRRIELQNIEPVLTACAVARNRQAGNTIGEKTQPSKRNRMISTATAVRSTTDPEPYETIDIAFDGEMTLDTGEAESAADTSSASPSDANRSAAVTEGNTGPPRAADLAALLQEATTLATETERRWSDALGVAVSDDIAGILARAGSLLSALYAEVAARQTTEQAAGLSSLLPGIPLDADTANLLDAEPQGQDRVTQHGLALAFAFDEVTRAIAALEQPTAMSLRLPEGTVMSWWRQHGFSHVHAAARMTWRVVDEPHSDAGRHWQDMEILAEEAWTAGLPEAALIYVIGTLDPEAEEAGPFANAYHMLKVAAQRLAAGDRLSLDASVPIVCFWLGELMHRDPPKEPNIHPQENASPDA